MNTKSFHILTIVCAFSVLSCEKATDTLHVMGNKVTNPLIKELVFSGDDIISYNMKTFEITFTNSAVDKLIYKDYYMFYYVPNYRVLSFYFNDKSLFINIKTRYTESGSTIINDLVFIVDGRSLKFYLADGYPLVRKDEWEDLYWNNKEELRKEREENAMKREVEWGIFIKYLSDKGKIVN